MYDEIRITQLNDFIFCPVSIYFHLLYGETDRLAYQSPKQMNGTAAHQTVDTATYSTRKNILMGIDVYCEEYRLIGKIDMFDTENGVLTERKRQVNKEAIEKIDGYLRAVKDLEDEKALLGIEGTAARVYFPQMFDVTNWKGRRPRIKSDYINTTLDIGYSLLFHLVDSLLQVYGFDVYCGVYHKEFYMRKSLACDLMEPLRPLIDLEVRKAINLKQCKEEDFELIQNQYCLTYKKSPAYVTFLMDAILAQKDNIFLYIQNYYRCFMKEKDISQYRGIEVV